MDLESTSDVFAPTLLSLLRNSQWTFHRITTSHNAFLPSSTSSGSANFSELGDAGTLLFSERGNLVTTEDFKTAFTRRYIYQLSEDNLELVVSFPSTSSSATGDITIGELFHNIIFQPGSSSNDLDPIVTLVGLAQNHQCRQDLYKTNYQFTFDAQHRLTSFEISDSVRGPQKDWEATTTYTPSSDLPAQKVS